MSADDHLSDRSGDKRSASLPAARALPAVAGSRVGLELFLSADPRKDRHRQGIDQAFGNRNKTTSQKEMRDEQAEAEETGGQTD
jgi:hypothetical protein